MNHEQAKIVAAELGEVRAELSVLKELVAVLLAEHAMTHPNPEAMLDRFITDEQGAVYGSVTDVDPTNEPLRNVLVAKASTRNWIFSFAKTVLARMRETR